MTPDAIQALNDRLPSGWLPQVMELIAADGKSLSAGQISRVKNGLSRNDYVMDLLLAMATKEDQRKANLAAAMRGEASIH